MGLFCASQGLGSFLGLALLNFCRLTHWINALTVRDIEEDRLDLYFFVLAGIQGLSVLSFVLGVKLKLCGSATIKRGPSTPEATLNGRGVVGPAEELNTSYSVST
jgi:hypothetical protein